MHYIDQYMLHLLREYSIKVGSRPPSVSRAPYPNECTVEANNVRVCACACVQVTDAYSEYDAGRAIRVLQAFINRELSSFYFSIIKDR